MAQPCGHRIMAPKAAVKLDKRLAEDIRKAQSAIEACERALTNPFFMKGGCPETMREAIESEIVRLQRATVEHRVLWAIYRRKDKGQPYYLPPVSELAIAA